MISHGCRSCDTTGRPVVVHKSSAKCPIIQCGQCEVWQTSNQKSRTRIQTCHEFLKAPLPGCWHIYTSKLHQRETWHSKFASKGQLFWMQVGIYVICIHLSYHVRRWQVHDLHDFLPSWLRNAKMECKVSIVLWTQWRNISGWSWFSYWWSVLSLVVRYACDGWD